MFGLVMATSYQRAIRLPDGLASEFAAKASHSIGETMLAAQSLTGEAGQGLAEAGRQAFKASHSMVLLAAAAMIGILSVVILLAFRQHPSESVSPDSHSV